METSNRPAPDLRSRGRGPIPGSRARRSPPPEVRVSTTPGKSRWTEDAATQSPPGLRTRTAQRTDPSGCGDGCGEETPPITPRLGETGASSSIHERISCSGKPGRSSHPPPVTIAARAPGPSSRRSTEGPASFCRTTSLQPAPDLSCSPPATALRKASTSDSPRSCFSRNAPSAPGPPPSARPSSARISSIRRAASRRMFSVEDWIRRSGGTGPGVNSNVPSSHCTARSTTPSPSRRPSSAAERSWPSRNARYAAAEPERTVRFPVFRFSMRNWQRSKRETALSRPPSAGARSRSSARFAGRPGHATLRPPRPEPSVP